MSLLLAKERDNFIDTLLQSGADLLMRFPMRYLALSAAVSRATTARAALELPHVEYAIASLRYWQVNRRIIVLNFIRRRCRLSSWYLGLYAPFRSWKCRDVQIVELDDLVDYVDVVFLLPTQNVRH
jgi:hypothetical protein